MTSTDYQYCFKLKVPQPRNVKAYAKLPAFYVCAVSICVGERVVSIKEGVMLRVQHLIVAHKHLESVAAGVKLKPERHVWMRVVGRFSGNGLVVIDYYCGAFAYFISSGKVEPKLIMSHFFKHSGASAVNFCIITGNCILM